MIINRHSSPFYYFYIPYNCFEMPIVIPFRLAIYDVILVRDLQCYLPTLPIASAFGLVIFSTYCGSPKMDDVMLPSYDQQVLEVQKKRCEIIAHLLIYGVIFVILTLLYANLEVINQSLFSILNLLAFRKATKSVSNLRNHLNMRDPGIILFRLPQFLPVSKALCFKESVQEGGITPLETEKQLEFETPCQKTNPSLLCSTQRSSIPKEDARNFDTETGFVPKQDKKIPAHCKFSSEVWDTLTDVGTTSFVTSKSQVLIGADGDSTSRSIKSLKDEEAEPHLLKQNFTFDDSGVGLSASRPCSPENLFQMQLRMSLPGDVPKYSQNEDVSCSPFSDLFPGKIHARSRKSSYTIMRNHPGTETDTTFSQEDSFEIEKMDDPRFEEGERKTEIAIQALKESAIQCRDIGYSLHMIRCKNESIKKRLQKLLIAIEETDVWKLLKLCVSLLTKIVVKRIKHRL